MFIFYEGLPRAGKSLSALKEYVVPMLIKGRKVFAYIEGLNHEQIAKLANITLEKCNELLIQLTYDDMPNWYKIVTNNSFVVLDEINVFYPKSRKPLTKEQIDAFAQYGHRGLDILVMGQVFTETHTTLTNRCSQRILFHKREAAGKPDEFTQIVYKPVPKGDKVIWLEVRSIKAIPYDTNYFGAYKSHTDETDNKETLVDDRANAWNNPVLKKWLPIYGVVFVIALIYVIYTFKGGGLAPVEPRKPIVKKSQTTTLANFQQKISPINNDLKKPIIEQKQEIEKKDFVIKDEITALNEKGRIRLSGYIRMGNKVQGIIEWRGDSNRVIERLTFEQLKIFGYLVLVDTDGTIAQITNGTNHFIATSFPIQDADGEASQAKLAQVKYESSQTN